MKSLLRTLIQIYWRPTPFVHNKLLAIDDDFIQIRRYNMDPRSLWMNIEPAVNSCDHELRERNDHYLDAEQPRSSHFTYEEMGASSILARIRDAFSVPYARRLNSLMGT